MPIYPEPNCSGCGIEGYTQYTCPRCNFCVYCKRKGHVVAACKKLRCYCCGKHGHKQLNCPTLQPSLPQVQQEPARKRTTRKKLDHVLNISVAFPRHDAEEWKALDPAVRDSVVYVPDLVCPDMTILCHYLLQRLVNGVAIPGSENGSYQKDIIAHGAIASVATELLSHIDPQVKDLKGKKLTRSALDAIRSTQSDPWPSHIGYMDYVTDSRLDEYFRIYVGQSGISRSRILLQRAQAIFQGKNNTLHYFLLWIGNGHRSANMLRLWSFPGGTTDTRWSRTKNNLLEILLSLFFRSLPSVFIDGVEGNPHDGYGLNIMSPLLQSRRMRELERLPFILAASKSPDPQIRAWAKRRRGIATRRVQHRRPAWSDADYMDALRRAIEPVSGLQLFESMKALLETETNKERMAEIIWQSDRPLPLGSFNAPIGFVLDFAVTDDKCGYDEVGGRDSHVVPWALRTLGFDLSNCLFWAFDFHTFSSLTAKGLSNFANTQAEVQPLHQTTID